MSAVELDVELVEVDSLVLHPDNPRQGDIGAIATSIERNGWYGALVVQKETNRVLVGNHRLQAAQHLGFTEVPVHWVDVDEVTARRILLADNKTSDLAAYNEIDLVALLKAQAEEDDLLGTGWDAEDLDDLLKELENGGSPGIQEGEIPDPPKDPITKLGDLIQLGEHRLICGDTTDPKVLEQLLEGETITLLHADPPYGMGKEKEGILNDNLYQEKLDEFQMEWWRAWRKHTAENGSAYIWGNPAELWRLWYQGGLGDEPDVTYRNEIVWDKGSGFGMRAEQTHSYPISTERVLFLMLGQQFLGNQNLEDYWEGYEPLRTWMEQQRDNAGWTNSEVNRITNSHMAGHWFTKSQFQVMNREVYDLLQERAAGAAFVENYDDLFVEFFPDTRGDGNAYKRELAAQLREERTTFDNTHEAMTEVWNFPRVIGEERFGHATPKPLEAMWRILKSSTEAGDLIGVPFGGTCPEIVAAERLGRRCVIAELEPAYCDIIVARWEGLTGKKAQR